MHAQSFIDCICNVYTAYTSEVTKQGIQFMPCGWGVKAGMVHEWVADKTM